MLGDSDMVRCQYCEHLVDKPSFIKKTPPPFAVLKVSIGNV